MSQVLSHKYVYHRDKLPTVYLTYFEENKVPHCHDTRQKNDFHMYAVQSEVGIKIIRYKGTKLRNNLPDDTKQISSPSPFKYRLKCYMLQSLEPQLIVPLFEYVLYCAHLRFFRFLSQSQDFLIFFCHYFKYTMLIVMGGQH